MPDSNIGLGGTARREERETNTPFLVETCTLKEEEGRDDKTQTQWTVNGEACQRMTKVTPMRGGQDGGSGGGQIEA